jgi:hypothetical protein
MGEQSSPTGTSIPMLRSKSEAMTRAAELDDETTVPQH